MDNINDPTLVQVRNGARTLKKDFDGGARSIKSAVGDEFKNLIDDVEDLIARVASVTDPEIAKIRDKVKDALSSAKDTLSDRANTVRKQARQVAGSTDEFVRENPWQAMGVAALVGIAVGFLASRRS